MKNLFMCEERNVKRDLKDLPGGQGGVEKNQKITWKFIFNFFMRGKP